MDTKFIILYILFAITENAANQSTITGSTSSPSSSFTTTAHTVPADVSLTVLELHSSNIFTPEYNNSESQAFKDRAKFIKDSLETSYKLKFPSFIRVVGISFR
ncbi:hypothetical protein QQF64_000608 [Cirrhinus molitorella]|uniref:SEA domain-containing protein n=1 Tax=Cirrhinus molitorella TaxID=172907 RepID=A0ABR3NXP4_9TELE